MRKIVGIDIGATNLRVALATEGGEILKLSSEKTDSKNLMDQIYKRVDQFSDFYGIGIAYAGPLNVNKGIILNPPNINVKNLKIVDMIKKKYGKQCYMLNDCVASVLAEKKFGAGKNVQNLVYITLSTGIGCGVIVDDRIVIGKDGNAHEMGHNTVQFESKMTCGCGGYGHWEAFCSGKNVPNYTKYLLETEYADKESALRTNSKQLDSQRVFELAGSDKVATEIVDKIGRINAIGVAGIINAYDPELITIGGGVTIHNQEKVIKPITKYVKEYTINRVPKIIITPIKDIAIVGAVASFLYMEDKVKNAK